MDLERNISDSLESAMRILSLTMVIGLLSGASAWQNEDDPYSIGVTLSSRAGCPVFVIGVSAESPAKHSGIQAGDKVLAVEGTPVKDLKTATNLLQSSGPTPVDVRLERGEKEVDVVVGREKRSAIYRQAGQNIMSGVIVPFGTTQAEVDRMLSFDGHRFVGRAFLATHYPRNPQLFYGGFEMFILRDPAQVTVGGIENGPAARAGVHWGDVVISVNGIPIAGKTATELESLFSAREPAIMHLQIDRLGSQKTFDFHLENAEDIAHQNGKQFVDGQIVPLGISEEDLHCFLK